MTETQAIMASIKTKIGPAVSITHLAHAAMEMSAFQMKSPHEGPSSTKILTPLWINGRRYLDPQSKAANYVPMCRAIGAIEFRNVKEYIISENASVEEMQQKLKKACEEARRGYQAFHEQRSLLTESFSAAESMANANSEIKGKGLADPFFLSDGILERYINRLYMDETRDHQVLSVEDLRFTPNPDGPRV